MCVNVVSGPDVMLITSHQAECQAARCHSPHSVCTKRRITSLLGKKNNGRVTQMSLADYRSLTFKDIAVPSECVNGNEFHRGRWYYFVGEQL